MLEPQVDVAKLVRQRFGEVLLNPLQDRCSELARNNRVGRGAGKEDRSGALSQEVWFALRILTETPNPGVKGLPGLFLFRLR